MSDVLILSESHRYGKYLQSLLAQAFLESVISSMSTFRNVMLERHKPNLVIIDLNNSSLQHIPNIIFRKCPNIVCIHNGNDNFHSESCTMLRKPIDAYNFLKVVNDLHIFLDQDTLSDNTLSEPYLIGNSLPIQKLRKDILKLSASDLSVLILGQTGTGKGVLAFSLHNNSSRKFNNYLEINCASVPASLLESELFGYKKGAFTGAWKDKKGKFQVAEKGTIFLDEISEMTPSMQAKLLQVLQDGQFSPVGGVEDVQVNVRIVAATNANIHKMMEQGQFREDLYYRLSVITLQLPPLKDRREDIPVLTHYFLDKYSRLYNKNIVSLSETLYELFEKYDWPGNVRELENMIKMVVALENESIVFDKLQSQVDGSNVTRSSTNYEHKMNDIYKYGLKGICNNVAYEAEKDIIVKAIRHTNGNKKQAARILDISYKSILNKIRDYGL